jgi:hypothetical protein
MDMLLVLGGATVIGRIEVQSIFVKGNAIIIACIIRNIADINRVLIVACILAGV